MLGYRVGGNQVHGAGPETVLGTGEGTYGADLDDVAREVGGEGASAYILVSYLSAGG